MTQIVSLVIRFFCLFTALGLVGCEAQPESVNMSYKIQPYRPEVRFMKITTLNHVYTVILNGEVVIYDETGGKVEIGDGKMVIPTMLNPAPGHAKEQRRFFERMLCGDSSKTGKKVTCESSQVLLLKK